MEHRGCVIAIFVSMGRFALFTGAVVFANSETVARGYDRRCSSSIIGEPQSLIGACRDQAKAPARSVTGAAVVLLSSRVDSSALRRLLMGGFPTRQQCLG